VETSLSATAESPAIHGWLTPKQAGEYLGYSAWTIRDLCKRSLLKHSRAPGGYRFRREWLDAFLDARAVEPKAAMVAPKRKAAAREEGFAVDDELAAAIRKAKAKLARAK
jgi:excisionase family DNA binding protein